VDDATLAAALADWNDWYRPRSAAARQLTAICAQADVILRRCQRFLDDHINAQVSEVLSDWERLPEEERDQADLLLAIGRSQLPCDKTVSRQFLRCHGKWLPIFLHCSDILPLVLEFDAWAACAATAAAGGAAAMVAEPEAPGPTPDSGADFPAEPGCPLPAFADLAVVRPGDRQTHDAVCQEGPSEGKTATEIISPMPFPSTGLGCDEPGSGNPADPSARATSAPCSRQRPHGPLGSDVPDPKRQVPTNSQAPDPSSQIPARRETGNSLPVTRAADLAVARPGDRQTHDAVCKEGPSKGKAASQIFFLLPFPSTSLGYDEPGSGYLADAGAVGALAPYARPGLYDPRPPPDRTVCDAA
jgi:hypothetical protein